MILSAIGFVIFHTIGRVSFEIRGEYQPKTPSRRERLSGVKYPPNVYLALFGLKFGSLRPRSSAFKFLKPSESAWCTGVSPIAIH